MIEESEMTERQLEIIDFLNSKYPNIEDVDVLCTSDALSLDHCFKYSVYRGRIQKITPLSFKKISTSKTELPDKLDYLAELHDEVGKIILHSPTAVDEKKIHAQMVEAHNNDQVVELLVAIFPYYEINEHGKTLNYDRKVITIWPIKLRVIKDPGENAEFRNTGAGWDITFRRKTEPYPNLVGFQYLHLLLQRPNELIPTGELSISANGIPNIGIDPRQIKDYLNDDESHNDAIDKYMQSYNPWDGKAVHVCKSKILKLKAEIGNLDEHIDNEKIQDHLHEIDQFNMQILTLIGLGDEKGNVFTDIVKKSRSPVINAINRTVDLIKAKQPAIGALLDERITAASECQYTEDVDHPITWLT